MPRSDDVEPTFADRLGEYVSGVLSGQRIVGRLERVAVERHVADLERDDGVVRFNLNRATRAVWWIESKLRFFDGEWAGRPFRLEPFELFVVAALFGWEERDSSGSWRRRFRKAYITMARKNGKTTLLAAIALLMLRTGGAAASSPGSWAPLQGAQVYSAATTRDQAALAWRIAAQVINASPKIRNEFVVPRNVLKDARLNVVFPAAGAFFKALSSDSNTLDGLNPFCAIVDELHAHRDGGVWDVLWSGMGAQREPLLVAITTAGSDRAGICGEVEDDAVKVLEGVYRDDSLFAMICRLDEADDPFDEKAWPKANPMLGVTVSIDDLRIAATTAAQNPGRRNEFLRKRVNLWTSGQTAWLPLDVWDACSEPVDLEELRGREAFAAFDLGSTRDTTSLAIAVPLDGDRVALAVKVYVPEDTIGDSTIRGPRERELLRRWILEGRVTATPGNFVDYGAARVDLLSLAERFVLREVIFDRWQASSLVGDCEAAGLTPVYFGQGYKDMNPAIANVERLLGARLLKHGGDPVLRWMFSNVSILTDPAGNRKFDKRNKTARIDGVVAAAMALRRVAESGIETGGLFVTVRASEG